MISDPARGEDDLQEEDPGMAQYLAEEEEILAFSPSRPAARLDGPPLTIHR